MFKGDVRTYKQRKKNMANRWQRWAVLYGISYWHVAWIEANDDAKTRDKSIDREERSKSPRNVSYSNYFSIETLSRGVPGGRESQTMVRKKPTGTDDESGQRRRDKSGEKMKGRKGGRRKGK